MCHSVLHQFSGICPFIILVVWPATGKQCHYKCTILTLQSPYIAISGIPGKPCFPGNRAIHHLKKCIVVAAAKIPLSLSIRKAVCRHLRDCKKFCSFGRTQDTVAHDFCQICSWNAVHTAHILFIQSVWRNKMCLSASDLFCLFIHPPGKLRNGSCKVFRDRHCRIIMGFQHQGI